MVTINQSNFFSRFKTDNFYGPSPVKKILTAIIIIMILIMGIAFLKQLGQPKVEEVNQNIIVPSVIYNLAGLVKEIKESSFVLEASIPQVDQAGKVTQKKEMRKINVTANTRFSHLTFVAQPGTTAKSPLETPMNFNEMKVGDYIEVIASQDISKAQDFEASQVRELPRNF